MTNERVKRCYEQQPKPRSKYENDLDPTRPLLLIVGFEEHSGELAIRRNGREIFSYRYDANAGWLLNFEITDSTGQLIFQIEDNAMFTPGAADIDFNWAGGELVWKDRTNGHVFIHIRLDGNRNALVIQHIDAFLGGINITRSSSGLLAPRFPNEVGPPSGVFAVGPGASATFIDCIEVYEQADGTTVTRHIGNMTVNRTGRPQRDANAIGLTRLAGLLPTGNELPRVNVRPSGESIGGRTLQQEPNKPCRCGSGKKFKKCCGRPR